MIKIYPKPHYIRTGAIATLMSIMPTKTTTMRCSGSIVKAAPKVTTIEEVLHTQGGNILMDAFGTLSVQAPKKTGKAGQHKVPLPSINMDVSKTRYEGDPQFLNQFLNGVLSGKGNAFCRAQNKYGINATFLMGISIQESGHGTSEIAKKYNNVGGMRGSRGYLRYPSVEVCIDSIASNLKRKYIAQGLKTPAQIGKKYAKDPKWAQKIVAHMRKIYDNQ